MTMLKLSRWVLDKFTNSREPKPPALTEIGLTEPICPHCGVTLSKMPGQKIACKTCGGAIHSRKRPVDETKALFRPDQLDELEEQRAVKNGLWQTFRREREEMESVKEEIRRSRGYEPSNNDVLWGIYTKRQEKAFFDSKWLSYQLISCQMAKLLLAEQKYADSISHFSVYLYFGMNGARDASSNKDGSLRVRWEPDMHLWGDGINGINEAIARGSFNEDVAYSSFYSLCARHFEAGYGIPISPSEAWKTVRPELIFN